MDIELRLMVPVVKVTQGYCGALLLRCTFATPDCVFLHSRRTFPLSTSLPSGLFDLLDFVPTSELELTHFSLYQKNRAEASNARRPRQNSSLAFGVWSCSSWINGTPTCLKLI